MWISPLKYRASSETIYRTRDWFFLSWKVTAWKQIIFAVIAVLRDREAAILWWVDDHIWSLHFRLSLPPPHCTRPVEDKKLTKRTCCIKFMHVVICMSPFIGTQLIFPRLYGVRSPDEAEILNDKSGAIKKRIPPSNASVPHSTAPANSSSLHEKD